MNKSIAVSKKTFLGILALGFAVGIVLSTQLADPVQAETAEHYHQKIVLHPRQQQVKQASQPKYLALLNVVKRYIPASRFL